MLLSVKNLTVKYGKAEALKNVSLELDEGHIIAVVGANGAGKTTLLRSISGLKQATSGEIWFANRLITKASPSRIVGMGICHIPQGRRLFPYMTVTENLMMGAYLRRDRDAIKSDLADVYGHFPVLERNKGRRAETFSGGEQQMLAIGRALMSRPKILLMDEPSHGLSPIMVDEISKVIADINKRGISVVLVEQNVTTAFRLASMGYVLATGRVVLEGRPSDLQSHDEVRRAYLGT
jgi:branched-chain amino acid transport system ATP-binding protein